MSNSLADILADKNFDEPSEMVAIKAYAQEKFQEDVGVTVRERDILIQVRSAALANALRLQTTQLQTAAKTIKRLTFRIG